MISLAPIRGYRSFRAAAPAAGAAGGADVFVIASPSAFAARAEIDVHSPFPGATPILTAQDWPYPANTVFNAGACQMGDETILLVRVEDRRGHSHLTVARSNDGISNWHIDSKRKLARVQR